MFNKDSFELELLKEYRERYPLDPDKLIEQAVTNTCAKMVVVAFELYLRDDH